MRTFIVIFCFAFSYTIALSQSAVIYGSVSLEEGDPAIGATVEILNTELGAVVDLDGSFEISSIPLGTQQIYVHYIGTEATKVEHDFTNDERYELNIKLHPATNTLQDVIVTAKSVHRAQEEKAMVIESVDLKGVVNQVKDLNQVVDQMSGVRVRTSGSLGDRADISLNGLNGTAVRTYLDGMPLEFIYPSASLSNLPLANIKRMDVYKGVVPITIGTDALGGAINVVTEYKPYNSIKASYSLGSFNTHQVNVDGNYVINDHMILTGSASYNYSDNDYEMTAYVKEDKEEKTIRRFNDAYDLRFIQLGMVLKEYTWVDHLKISGGYIDYYKEYQHGGIITRAPYGEVLYTGSNKAAFITYQKTISNLAIENSISYSDESTMFIDTTNNKYSWSGHVIARRPTTSKRGELAGKTDAHYDYRSLANRTNMTYPLNSMFNITLTNIFGLKDLTGRDKLIPSESDLLTKPQVLAKNISGLELASLFFRKKIRLAAAIKNYYYSLKASDVLSFTEIDKKKSTLGYYVSSKYNISNDFFVRASYERALRIPTFIQFFGDGRTIRPNTSLKPESSNNYNAGITYNSIGGKLLSIDLSTNFFLRNQKDIIFLTGAETQRFINAESVDSRGMEVEARINIKDHIRLDINATKLIKVYASIDSTLVSSQFLVGTAFPNTPSAFGNIRLSYVSNHLVSNHDRLRLYTQYKYVDEYNFINVSKTRNDNSWIPTQHRLDVGFTYAFYDDTYSISANVYNVLGKELFDNFKIPRPGRSYNMKFIYQFNNI